ncbi:hypothetical protein [Novosphingobium sp. BW1]|uniref:hypothetical protein n=1 Tax=Novosphingobium sp. BW1 TaxID=2592621 RepID=UPI0011DEB2CE|nr:hypothetical protein [Novosphingobium sp. BW1]TYC85479.1 hypothetical protein FMM79_16725 [Novosphingobium sp. BW1]
MRTRISCAGKMAGAALLALALCACSSQAPEPAPTPTTYDIDKADLSAPEPGDICRTRNAAFLRDVLLQISAVLPSGSRGLDFRKFRVDQADNKGLWTATVGFQVGLPGEPAQAMHAVASFDPEDCTTGEWSVRDGGTGEASER